MPPIGHNLGASADAETGSRASTEPSSTVSALTGFDPARLRELAKRCATTRDGDMVELLEEAFALCFPKPTRIWETDNTGDWTVEYADYHERSWRFSDLMEAGAFVDAARELLAPNTLWAVGSMEDGPFARLCWPMPGGSYVGGSIETKARGAALALCSAALRGHAIAIEARQRTDREDGLDPKGESAGPQDIAQRRSR